MYKFLKFFLFAFIATAAIFTACNKNEDVAVEDALDQALYTAQERGGFGKYGCYELIFPVTIILPDSSSVETNSYEDIKNALRTYFQANGTGQHPGQHGGRPHLTFAYPITVLSQDGNLITVNNQEELRQLRADCAGTFGNHNHHGHGQHGLACFDIVFPITILFPDSTTTAVNSRQEMHQAIRIWKQANPGADQRPQIVFPITVQMRDDSSLVTVNSRQELRQLKEDCE